MQEIVAWKNLMICATLIMVRMVSTIAVYVDIYLLNKVVRQARYYAVRPMATLPIQVAPVCLSITTCSQSSTLVSRLWKSMLSGQLITWSLGPRSLTSPHIVAAWPPSQALSMQQGWGTGVWISSGWCH